MRFVAPALVGCSALWQREVPACATRLQTVVCSTACRVWAVDALEFSHALQDSPLPLQLAVLQQYLKVPGRATCSALGGTMHKGGGRTHVDAAGMPSTCFACVQSAEGLLAQMKAGASGDFEQGNSDARRYADTYDSLQALAASLGKATNAAAAEGEPGACEQAAAQQQKSGGGSNWRDRHGSWETSATESIVSRQAQKGLEETDEKPPLQPPDVLYVG
jgi:hypothetical protein